MEEEVGWVRGKKKVKQHMEGKGAEAVLGMKSGAGYGVQRLKSREAWATHKLRIH